MQQTLATSFGKPGLVRKAEVAMACNAMCIVVIMVACVLSAEASDHSSAPAKSNPADATPASHAILPSQPAHLITASIETTLPEGWQNLPFDKFGNVVANFYRKHSSCDHCRPLRRQLAANAWDRFLRDPMSLDLLVRTDLEPLLTLIGNVGTGLQLPQQEQLADNLQSSFLHDPGLLRSLNLQQVVSIQRVLQRLHSSRVYASSLVTAWLSLDDGKLLSNATLPEAEALWNLIAFDHSEADVGVKNVLCQQIWGRFLNDAKLRNALDDSALIRFCSTIGHNLGVEQKATLLAELSERFIARPEHINGLNLWKLIKIKSALVAMGASDQQVIELLGRWASEGNDWTADVTANIGQPGAHTSSSAIAEPRSEIAMPLTPSQIMDRDFEGMRLLIQNLPPHQVFNRLVEVIGNSDFQNAVAQKLLAHSAVAAGEQASWMAKIKQIQLTMKPGDELAAAHIAVAYLSAASARSIVEPSLQNELESARANAISPSLRMACVK